MNEDILALRRRFESKVERIPEAGCWIWMGQIDPPQNYGKAWYRGKFKRAHRVSWMLYRGDIPATLHVLHHCDITYCVNPNHLFVGTHQDNMDDMARKGRRRAAYGDANGMRLHPESVQRGENHSAHLKPWTRPRGTNHPCAKLTDAQVLAIRADPRPNTKIAAEYGVVNQLVSMIKRRKIWGHL